MIYLIGKNSFIAKSLYLELRKLDKVILLSHNDIEQLKIITDSDIIINLCGINRANSYDEYYIGNFIFIKKMLEIIGESLPYIIHFSSYMINGFKNKTIDQLSDYQKWFIDTKIMGENYLLENYKNVCIIRPSNIYGYMCEPYYNNLLSTLVYEKICGITKINKINKNCFRNMLSIDGLINFVLKTIVDKQIGIYNVISNNTYSILNLLNILYNNDIPNYFNIIDDNNVDIMNNNNNNDIIINENIVEKINKLEKDMKVFLELKNGAKVEKLNKLVQDRGDMVEISNLNNNRLYKITLNKHSVRGNHYHYKQIEEFYVNNGLVTFVLINKDNLDVKYIEHLNNENKVVINPNIIHTLINDYNNNISDIFVVSTQPYIKDVVLDTEYVNVI